MIVRTADGVAAKLANVTKCKAVLSTVYSMCDTIRTTGRKRPLKSYK